MADIRVVEVSLPNGASALVRVRDLDGGATAKSAFGDRFDFSEVGSVLEGLTQGIREALVKAAPDKVTVQLGLELATKTGKLTGLLVEGEGKGSLSVTLEWRRDPAPSPPPLPA